MNSNYLVGYQVMFFLGSVLKYAYLMLFFSLRRWQWSPFTSRSRRERHSQSSSSEETLDTWRKPSDNECLSFGEVFFYSGMCNSYLMLLFRYIIDLSNNTRTKRIQWSAIATQANLPGRDAMSIRDRYRNLHKAITIKMAEKNTQPPLKKYFTIWHCIFVSFF